MYSNSDVEILEFVDVSDKLSILILLWGKDGLEIDPLSLHLHQHF